MLHCGKRDLGGVWRAGCAVPGNLDGSIWITPHQPSGPGTPSDHLVGHFSPQHIAYDSKIRPTWSGPPTERLLCPDYEEPRHEWYWLCAVFWAVQSPLHLHDMTNLHLRLCVIPSLHCSVTALLCDCTWTLKFHSCWLVLSHAALSNSCTQHCA